MRGFIKQNIKETLKSQGCPDSVAAKAADIGLSAFDKGNQKDPFFDSLCVAGQYAEKNSTGFKFKKPKNVNGKPFVYGKPKSRKHKQQQTMF